MKDRSDNSDLQAILLDYIRTWKERNNILALVIFENKYKETRVLAHTRDQESSQVISPLQSHELVEI